MPYTVAAGTAAGIVVGVTMYRWLTAPYEGKLSVVQDKFEEGVAVASGSEKIVVKRVERTTTAFADAGRILADHYAGSPLMQASVPNVRFLRAQSFIVMLCATHTIPLDV